MDYSRDVTDEEGVNVEEVMATTRAGCVIRTMAMASAIFARKERGKFEAGGLIARGLIVACQIDQASKLGTILWDKGVRMCAVQETWLDPAIEEIK